ncbi:uncharacterized protein LOC110702036 [Chenopodium quinoa]|uniref:uncharacterized protein LOC110702036 n=1 Tax=Chenopodium quinoa TaxID=63459 RepID=UPI000B76F416|nr:uncharacterized protein LOC110702036 [Chenopodium quinoa]
MIFFFFTPYSLSLCLPPRGISDFLASCSQTLNPQIEPQRLFLPNMASLDNKDTPPAKKMKLEEKIPNPKDGTNENLEYPKPKDYFVLLKLEVILQNRESGGDVMSLFHKVMKDAGCSESQITPPHTSYNFFARLTEEEANKLAGLDSVKKVRPKVNSRWFSEFL